MDDPFLSMPTNDATLADLRLENVRLAPEAPGKVLRDLFEDRKQLAGVLVVEGTRLVGLISRDMFLRQLTRPFGREVYACRSVRVLLAEAQLEPWRLPSSLSVQEAAHRMLRRPNELLYEPLVVDFEDGDFRLLSIPSLLLAQSQLLALANDTIVRQKEAAMAASRAKGQFLANISHEIRTPLTAVQGFARIGARDSTDADSRETFSRIIDAGNHLLAVINDILDFSKIEAGKLVIESRPVRLTEITAEAIALMQGRASEKGLELTHRPSPDLPEWIMGDPMRIRQILVNLLSNAIKFSRHGTIDLTVLRAEEEIWFAVRDEGIGMTEEEISRLFRPFEQADSSITRKYGGTGLGLSISMNLASLMGGTIQVVSTQWRGSTFTLQLPLKETSVQGTGENGQEQQFSMAGKLAGFHILAAEDIEANRLILADMLDEAGASYVFAENGRVAVEQVVAAPQAFDVVLMDIQMPEMDGNEATRRIHEIVPTLPIIGLTAHGMSQDRATSLAAGMKDHVTKPIDPKGLVTAILCWATPGRMLAPLPRPIIQPTEIPISAAPAPSGGAVDWALLNTRFKGKRSAIQAIIRSVLADHADAPARLRRFAAARDFEALAFLAHNLKSIFGNLAAAAHQEVAAILERAARQGDERSLQLAIEFADSIPPLFAELERYLVAE